MRSLILILSLAIAVPMMPTMASASGHSCNQLRQSVITRVPVTSRNLPYTALPCSSISELHLLLSRASSYSNSYLTQRIAAVFRRAGLIR